MSVNDAKPKGSQLSPARKVAFEILLRVERDQAWATELLNTPRMDRLSREDRTLAHELVLSTLRWQGALDARIAQFSKQKLSKLDAEVRVALRLGACQLNHLDRIPQHAAVHETVEMVKTSGKRSAAPFANAILRKLAASARQPLALDAADPAASLALELSHPAWLVQQWIDMYGYEAARTLCEAGQHPSPTALRLTSAATERELSEAGITLAPGALLRSARRLVSGPLATSAAFREGRAAIQDEASQLVAALVGHGQQILDGCAAPGGKTAAIASANPQARITAVELHPHRARLLEQRLAAYANVEVRCGDITQLEWPEKFDRILADVPCSGTGTLAANPEIRWRLTPESVSSLQYLQVSILRKLALALAPGGRMIYSTCSLERQEGEDVVEKLLAEDSSLALLDCREVLEELRAAGELADEPEGLLRGPYLRTRPGLHPCEGFFAAVITRR